jgi:hypothetical protein
VTARQRTRSGTAALPKVAVAPTIADAITSGAEALDIEDGIFLAALISGAVKLGQADRLVLAALDDIPHKRRARKPLPWAPDAPTVRGAAGVNPEAATWRYGDWTLVRLGNPARSNNPEPDAGWYLEGPGVPDAVNVGLRRKVAQDEADNIIRRYERQHPDPLDLGAAPDLSGDGINTEPTPEAQPA